MRTIVFEDEAWSAFTPIASTRHLSLLALGAGSSLDHLRRDLRSKEVSLAGRDYLAATSKRATGLPFNQAPDDDVLLVNARLRPGSTKEIEKAEEGRFISTTGGEVVLAKLDAVAYNGLRKTNGVITQDQLARLSKDYERLECTDRRVFSFPWEQVDENGRSICQYLPKSKESTDLPDGCTLKGNKKRLLISPRSRIDPPSFFDTREGPIIVEDEVEIEAFSHVRGPCFIGKGSRVHSALIRKETTIGEGCRIGGEVESSIIYPHTNKAHHGYLGNAIVGAWVNLGAGSTVSNLKNTYGPVRVMVGTAKVDSGMQRLGPMIGDMAKIAIGCLVFAGKKIGVGSHAMGLVNRDVPSFTFYDGNNDRAVELQLSSVLATQRRMMRRRNVEMGDAMERLVRTLFRQTQSERRAAKVARGSLVA